VLQPMLAGRCLIWGSNGRTGTVAAAAPNTAVAQEVAALMMSKLFLPPPVLQ
jgi:hypothetical protein